MVEFGYFKDVNLSFNSVVKKLPIELKRKGFEVLSTVRMDNEFHNHLGVDFKKYVIMSISNLQLAYKALVKEDANGLLQTYNVIIYQKNNVTVVGVLRPTLLISAFNSEYLNEGALIIERKLLEILEALEKKRFLKEKVSGKKEKQGAIKAVA
jgi:uncharacterized protein (DUF302 family)